MYLLNQSVKIHENEGKINLHSTMYLLNQADTADGKGGVSEFTFHYVSIKSYLMLLICLYLLHLHSTMYLLNLIT